eukprot:gene23028-29355_t
MPLGPTDALTDRPATGAKACPDQKAFHVAIIMDGNGRWAKGRGQIRTM